mgnify:CR=1 FL=1
MRLPLLLTVIGVLSSVHSNAGNLNKESEQKDSLRTVYMRGLALKHPALRQIQFSNEFIPYRKVESSHNGTDFIKGDAQIIRNSFQFRIPLLSWKKTR